MSASGATSGEKYTRRRGSATTIGVVGPLALALLVAGCGASTLTPGSTSAATQTTSTTPEPGANATATAQASQSPASVANATSCSPSNQQTIDVGNPRFVLAATTPGRTVTVHVGDIVQVRLPSTSRWSFQAVQGAAALTSIAPSGMYAPALKACVWTFQATSAGAETLRYAGAPICKPGQPCAAYRIAMDFSVNVS
ncbi:MAG TPA: hypothetical protein VGP82_10185 [Ktedonobacterales bacterium]|nr:hypothetical protein [Ktedonobacterales bacterium]